MSHRPSDPIVCQFAIAGIDVPGIFPDQVRNATVEMASLPVQSGMKDALLGMVGLDSLASDLASATNAEVCLRHAQSC